MKRLNHLYPQPLWNYFEDICQIPRPSKKEEKVIAFLLDFAATHHLEAKVDEIGNVLIRKPATSGRENDSVVVLQSHMAKKIAILFTILKSIRLSRISITDGLGQWVQLWGLTMALV
jgi:putative aminopeptidase FrvX